MCGIAGIFAYDDGASPVDGDELSRMRERMRARGPEAAANWIALDRRVGLAHRRLAIIDLSPAGAQPMASADGRYVVTFNGEIYNHRELRHELERDGWRFRSQSDTEVLLALYARRKSRMTSALRGMYAFAIWDAVERTLFLARDPYGIKPLYYADDGRTFRFASQAKALIAGGRVDPAPDPGGVAGYLLLGSVPEPFTIYRNVRPLPAGCAMHVRRRGAGEPLAHFDLTACLADAHAGAAQPRTRADRLELLRETIRGSIRAHLVADVPVGVFLSAGIDSGVLTALAAEESRANLRTLTLGFDEYRDTPDDEVPLAATVARRYGCDHHAEGVSAETFEDERARLLDAMDQPSIDGINTYLIARAARGAGMKVALSGLGGDELFGGYPAFRQIPKLVRAIGWMRHLEAIGRLGRRIARPFTGELLSPKAAGLLEYGATYEGAWLLRRSLFMPWELDRWLDRDTVRDGLAALDLRTRLARTLERLSAPHARVAALESAWYMRNQLLRDTDWAGMAHSVEIRTPFVDVEVLQTLACTLSCPTPFSKQDLAALPRDPLPAAVLKRAKTGFTTPVRRWIAQGRRPQRGLRDWALFVKDAALADATSADAGRRVIPLARHAGAMPVRAPAPHVAQPDSETPARATSGGIAARARPRTVIVYRVGQLGDAIVTIPALQALRAKHFDDRILLLTDHHPDANGRLVSLWDVLAPLGLVDDVLFYEPPGSLKGAIRAFPAMARALRGIAPDIVYNLAPPRTAWHRLRDRAFFAGALGVREYHGPRDDADEWPASTDADAARASDAAHAVEPPAPHPWDATPPRRPHRARRAEPEWQRLARIAVASPAPLPRFLPMRYEDADGADVVRRLFASTPDALSRPLVAVAPGSKMQAKRWPAAAYRETVATLAACYPEHRFVVIGDANDRAIAAEVAGAAEACIDVSGRLTLRELGALLARCVLFVGNDTGTMHLAALVGVPCVAIFSARDRALRWEPMGAGHRVLRHDPPCAGCMRETCTRGNACLTRIPPADVVHAASAILDTRVREAHADAERAAAD